MVQKEPVVLLHDPLTFWVELVVEAWLAWPCQGQFHKEVNVQRRERRRGGVKFAQKLCGFWKCGGITIH